MKDKGEETADGNATAFHVQSEDFRSAGQSGFLGSKFLLCGLIAVLVVCGISVYDNYGVSTDEEFEAMLVVWNLEQIGSDSPWRDIHKDGEYYGVFFNFISVMPYVVGERIQGATDTIPEIIRNGINSPEIYHSKHFFTFLFALLAYVGVALFTKEFLGYQWAGVAIVLLALLPRFWGHSFFNPKDIPFAATFTIVSYIGARITARFVEGVRSGISIHIVIGFASVLGVIAGALTAIRVGGLFSPVMAVMVTAVLLISNRTRLTSGSFLSLLVAWLTLVAVWFAVTIALTPAAWQEPISWFWETVSYSGGGVASSHGWGEGGKVNVTFGENWRIESAWYYMLIWLGITTPLPTAALAVWGWWVLIRRWPTLSERRRSIVLWLNLQAFLLPIIAIAKDAFFYNGVRHLLFLMPPLAVFAALGAHDLLGFARPRSWKAAVGGPLLVVYGILALEMVKLHPYEYTWFNILARRPEQSKMFETDYWGLSGREAIGWIMKQEGTEKTVLFHAPTPSIRPFASPGVLLQRFKPSQSEPVRPFYYLAFPRNHFGESPHPHDRFPDCPTVFRVERPLGSTKMLFTVVKYCE